MEKLTSEEFGRYYSPEMSYKYAMDEKRCHVGSAPTLYESVSHYGFEFVCNWLEIVFRDFVAFTGARQGINPGQSRQLATIFVTRFRSLKVTEVLLFFFHCKAGQYGKFYDRIDPMDLTAALSKFRVECDRIKGEHYYAEAQRQREEEREADDGPRYTFEEAIEKGLIKNPETLKFLKSLRPGAGGHQQGLFDGSQDICDGTK